MHTSDLPGRDLCEVGGVHMTSAARAVVDVARRESLVEAVAVGDAVLRPGAATVDGLLVALAAAAGLRGTVAARAVVPHLEPRSESSVESRLRLRLVLGGCRDPRPSGTRTRGRATSGGPTLDGVLPEDHGRLQRLDEGVFVADRRRQTALAETGLELRRFTRPSPPPAVIYVQVRLRGCLDSR
ncbi:MAG: hypothetical protein JWN08_98 [Frankiales bacterium]|nr:hypothetical protein [Frankiales bacterium]